MFSIKCELCGEIIYTTQEHAKELMTNSDTFVCEICKIKDQEVHNDTTR